MKELKKLYLNAWDYNTYRIMNSLKKEVLNNGGEIVSDWEKKEPEKIKIINRTLEEHKNKIKNTLEEMENNKQKFNKSYNEKQVAYIEKNKKELAKLEKINNKDLIVRYTTYLHFILNGKIYYIQFDDNPFFPFYYSKHIITDYKTTKNYYLEEMNKSIIWNNFDSFDYVSTRKINKTAKDILNYLILEKDSSEYKDKRGFERMTTYNVISKKKGEN